VFANFDRLVVNTKKKAVERAGTYAGFVIDTVKGRNVLMFLDIKITRMWEHVQWLDLHNYGGFHICKPEGSTDDAGWYKDRALLDSDTMTNEMNWNIGEYLPPACREVFLEAIGNYLERVIEYDDEGEEATKTGRGVVDQTVSNIVFIMKRRNTQQGQSTFKSLSNINSSVVY
jgi:DNA polymerase epsilon subunit 1